MKIQFFDFGMFHGRRNVGSVRIRVDNLLKHWPEASRYRFGDKPDVIIFQKVYKTFDYNVPLDFPALKILDICDPDFKDTPDIHLVETMNHMDAVVTPTDEFAKFLRQMTDTPVYVVPDRFDTDSMLPPKRHKGRAKRLVWYGYSHNADGLKLAIPSIERRGLELLVISEQDPFAYRWAIDSHSYQDKYLFKKFADSTWQQNLQTADICVLPLNKRPFESFKSNNKTVQAQLLGVPVATTAEEVDSLMDAESRDSAVDSVYGNLKTEYDSRKSVEEYKRIIEEISNGRER